MSQPIHGPHAHSNQRMPLMMLQVLLALTPATLYGFWLYGWPAFNLWLICLLSALGWEALFLKFFSKNVPRHLLDGSALVTGWLLALCLPPWAPWWLAVVGTFLAVAMIKQIFGGLGQNVFNPAMAARVMLLIAFPVEMTQWIAPEAVQLDRPDFVAGLGQTFGSLSLLDAYTGATLLDEVKNQQSLGAALPDILQAQQYNMAATLLGQHAGSTGESTALLLLLGGLFLLFRGVITWQAPVGLLLGLGVPALLMNLWQPESYPGLAFHLFTGGAMLAAWFIVTDPVTGPTTATGRLVFGLGCGLLAWLVRTWGSYPEGIAFAVMLMNSATPVLDRYFKPRIYGRTSSGAPLPATGKTSGDAS
ncbi:RnfABCDGE type electron transport complex subunit D [Marinospirillum alkaliphilum]|uniref:Ion-translocating oxidoreductase complex subunit D n=1 Tax=Marinospirillum alkaliphilum DSM 21637 TaxID=1122209 RepID=A0A1K1TB63_9GAMM|nr:RnfABCDGE type electron transport complex subunit D [Marinospirillum alkaliphilum]SFW97605.1 electron transport complex protein RnfD [Marinospirillum alkaliphilum DSM 21637]